MNKVSAAVSYIEKAGPGRVLPTVYPDRGKQFDEWTILDKIDLSVAEFHFLCSMIQHELEERGRRAAKHISPVKD